MKKLLLLTFILLGLSCASNNDDDNNQLDNGDLGCQTPSSLFVQKIATNSVEANWSDTNNSQLFIIEYGPRGFSLGNGTTTNSNTTFKELSGLTSNTQYDFYVKANCGGSTDSEWAGPHSFLTN